MYSIDWTPWRRNINIIINNKDHNKMARVESIEIILTQKSLFLIVWKIMELGDKFLILINFFLFSTDRSPLKEASCHW